jgi:hypothetical protein
MANRAYLYPSDSAEFRELERWNDDTPYYDSRHNMPVAWFFLFRPQDLVSIDVTYGEATWREPKFIASKEAALNVFLANRDLLMPIVGENFDCAKKLSHFSETLAEWSGSHLILDPGEIIAGGQDDSIFPCMHKLQCSKTSGCSGGSGSCRTTQFVFQSPL